MKLGMVQSDVVASRVQIGNLLSAGDQCRHADQQSTDVTGEPSGYIALSASIPKLERELGVTLINGPADARAYLPRRWRCPRVSW